MHNPHKMRSVFVITQITAMLIASLLLAQNSDRLRLGSVSDDMRVTGKLVTQLKSDFSTSDGFSEADRRKIAELTVRTAQKQSPQGDYKMSDLAQLAATRFGGLRIVTTPAGASVWVDDKQW